MSMLTSITEVVTLFYLNPIWAILLEVVVRRRTVPCATYVTVAVAAVAVAASTPCVHVRVARVLAKILVVCGCRVVRVLDRRVLADDRFYSSFGAGHI